MKITINGKTYEVATTSIENGIKWLWVSNGRHGYVVADLGNGQFGKVNKLY